MRSALAGRTAGQRRPKRDPFQLVVQDKAILTDGSPSLSKPEHLIKDPADGSLYLLYSLGSTQPTKLVKSTTGHPFGPYGAATTVVAAADAPFLVPSGGNYYIFAGNSPGTGITLYRSTTTITGTYTSLGTVITPGQVAYSDGVTNGTTTFTSASAVFASGDTGKTITGTGIPASTTMTFVNATTVTLSNAATTTATGVTFQILNRTTAWNAGRSTEPWVFYDTPNSRWFMLYMGFSSGELKEQVGVATAPAIEGPWTVQGAAPIVAVGTTVGDFDYDVVADPWLQLINGTYHLFYVAGRNTSKANSAPYNYGLATSPDLVTWTKRGRVLERPPWPATSSVAIWRGEPYLHTDGNYYFPRAGEAIRGAATGAAYKVQMDVIHPESFRNGLPTNAWTRTQHTTGTRAGTWTLLTNTAMDGNPGGSYFSATAGDTFTYTFTGQGIRWATVARDNCGQATVTLDGTVVATVDLYVADSAGFSQCHGYEAVGLENKAHTLVITALGTKTAAATAANVHVDYMEYLP